MTQPILFESILPQTGDPATVEIFDPPMYCPTGLCGPALDQTLLILFSGNGLQN